ncbi:uncharacterized protein [Triticum aestivum]|uniref:uncharacterized protein isoform X1 n=1 Tax=Triticum aestivum TaxID=4565 RepID=UPI001D02FCB1|nr:uncharacterized protein LOC123124268 isoform X1 [Triticum aestivum]
MADDELEQEQEQELVVPEADERSRWIARHPVGCAGVSLVCIYCHLVTDDPPLTLLILLLGLLAVFVYDLAWLYANDSSQKKQKINPLIRRCIHLSSKYISTTIHLPMRSILC